MSHYPFTVDERVWAPFGSKSGTLGVVGFVDDEYMRVDFANGMVGLFFFDHRTPDSGTKVEGMLKAWLRSSIEPFLRRLGFVPHSEWVTERDARNSAEVSVVTERRLHAQTKTKLCAAECFINKKLQSLTMLEPVMRWPKPDELPTFMLEPFELAHLRVMEFIEGKRKDIIIRVAISAIFDYWNSPFRQDIRAVDEAISYIAKAAAHQIAQTLRFGLTGDRA